MRKIHQKTRNELNKKRVVSLFMAMVILLTTVFLPSPPAGASSKYITAEKFIKKLVQAIKLEVDTTIIDPYTTAAITAGILKDSDKIELSKAITRTNAAVLLNRADEYLHGDTVDEKLLKFVLSKRISDIKKIVKSKRNAVAKVYAKGIIKGYSNGMYIQSRKFKGSSYMSSASANNFISLVVNTKKRAKLSPDGLLIRTTNLPKNAKKYEYILECYPNKFYEKKFEFMLTDDYKDKAFDKYFAYPVEMKNESFKTMYTEWPLSKTMDKYLYDWQALAEKYIHYIFNVDYRTVDSNWINGLGSLYARSNHDEAKDIKTYYIGKMKANKVRIQSSIIAVEPSTFYEDGEYCIRAYVKYRIIANDISAMQSKLIYAQYPNLLNLESGKWREGIFDVRFINNDASNGDGSDFGIDIMTRFNDSFNVSVK